MARVINLGFTDTPIAETPKLTRGKLNFATDWRMKSDNGTESIIVNLTSPLDRVETQKISVSSIANIYDRAGIDAKAQGPSKKGVNVYLQEKVILQVTDDADADFLEQHPIDVSIVIKTSVSEYVTADLVQTVLARAVSGLYDTGSETTTRLSAILRGSKLPSGI